VSFKNFNCIWTKEEGRIGRRLTQRKHDLKVLRANDNSWHFYRRWKSLLSWNAFFSDFTMSLLVLLLAFSFSPLFVSRRDARLIATRKCKIPHNVPSPYKSRFLQRNKCRNATWHWKPIESAKNNGSECAWLRLFPRQICARICKRQMQRRFMVYASTKRIRGNLGPENENGRTTRP